MQSAKAISTITCILASIAMAAPVGAQLVYTRYWMGYKHMSYIYKKINLGNGRWKFNTRVVSCFLGERSDCKAGNPYITEWKVADCTKRTINGEVVPTKARFGYERGKPELFKAICRSSPQIATTQPRKDDVNYTRSMPNGCTGVTKLSAKQFILEVCDPRGGNQKVSPVSVRTIGEGITLLKFDGSNSNYSGYYCSEIAIGFPQKGTRGHFTCTSSGWRPR